MAAQTHPRVPNPKAPERFWAKVDRSGACWEWTGARHGKGYGHFRYLGQIMKAHRVVLLLSGAEIPDGMTVDHLCMNTGCVRPEHLEIVPGDVNTLRGGNPCAVNARKTHCQHGHEFTVENTRFEGPLNRRRCRTCVRAYARTAS